MIMLRRSAPIMTLSLASSKSFMSTFSLLLRAAKSAASLTRFSRSAPAKAGGEPPAPADVDIIAHRHLARVHLENAFSAFDIRSRHDDAAIEAPGPEQSGVERSEERCVGKECRSRWSPYH